MSIGSGRAGSAGFFPGQWAALPVRDPKEGIDFVKRNKSVGEEAFNNRLDILNSLNTDFQEDFGTRDSQSYMDTYSGSLKFMNSKDIDAFELKVRRPVSQNCTMQVSSAAVVF